MNRPIACLLFLSLVCFQIASCASRFGKSLHLEPAIVQGVDADDGDALYLVQVRQYTSSGWYETETFCGGSLISGQTVVTAGHCVDPDNAYQTLIRYGTHQLDYSDYDDVDVPNENIHRHPDYAEDNAVNDIAVLNLPDAIQPASNVQFVSLQTRTVGEGTRLGIYGWGKTSSDGDQPEDLQKGSVTLVDRETCDQWTNYKGGAICSTTDTQSICSGDSGGGSITGDGLLTGVNSQASADCRVPGGVNIFTSIVAYRDFINQYTV